MKCERQAPPAKFRVAILLRLGSGSHRDRLVGIFNRLGATEDWDIRLLADEAALRHVLAGGGFPADGIITFMPLEKETRDALIAENALRGIAPADVARHLGISRRLLDLRFREFSKHTVLASINGIKLAEAKRLLKETARPIHLVFEAAGFADNNYAHHLFKTATGLTPSDYRRRG